VAILVRRLKTTKYLPRRLNASHDKGDPLPKGDGGYGLAQGTRSTNEMDVPRRDYMSHIGGVDYEAWQSSHTTGVVRLNGMMKNGKYRS
jgi:hypothetical protein